MKSRIARRLQRRCSSGSRNRQAGLVVAVILVGLAVAALAAVLTFASTAGSSLYSDRQTEDVVAQARLALIGRATADVNRPGSLPCPAADENGSAGMLSGPSCLGGNVGLFPWRTLGLPPLRDSSGALLWYALSPSLTDNASGKINSNSAGDISVIGAVPATDVAAVVIAPGAALQGQDREANPNAAAHFLEGENNNGDNNYQSGFATSTFNDRLAVITRSQLFNVVEWRVANEIRARLDRYYASNGYLPYANSTSVSDFTCTEGELRGRVPNPDSSAGNDITCSGHDGWNSGLSAALPQWFYANDWHLLTFYALAPACTKAHIGCNGTGFLQVNGTSLIRAVVIVGSRQLTIQSPACVAALCIEQPSAGSDAYVRSSASSSFNDKVGVIR